MDGWGQRWGETVRPLLNLTRGQQVEVNRGMRTKSRSLSGLAATLGLCLVVAGCNFAKTGAVAADAPDMVTVLPAVSGATTALTLDSAAAHQLTLLGVSVAPSGTATATGSEVTFPITSGYAEIHSRHDAKPGWIKGSLDHAGSGMELLGIGSAVKLTDFVVDPGGSMLYATVNGTVGVPFLFLDGSKVTATTNDVGQVVLAGTVAKLTQTAATDLNGAFATTALTAGTTLGTVRVVATGEPVLYHASPVPLGGLRASPSATVDDHVTDIPRLAGMSTTLTVNPDVASALMSSGLTLAPAGSASSSPPGAVTFPITAGFAAIHSDRSFSPGYIVGTIDHQGSGLTIAPAPAAPTAAGPPPAITPSVTLTDFVVDPGDSVLTGTVNDKIGVPLFYLNGSKLTVTPTPRGVTLDGTVAELTGVAATALDQAFHTRLFTQGMAIGTVHLVATGP